MKWLSTELKDEIRKVFEPRYKKKLSDIEVREIAINLTNGMQEILKLQCKKTV
jgi:hypothetical protein